MSDLYGQGLVVDVKRWKNEAGLIRKLLPGFAARAQYSLRSVWKSRQIARQMARFEGPALPLFRQVELETHNRCNAECAFCPVNRKALQRPYARMSEELFSRILDDLAALRFSGALSLHSNNEPLLDKRLPDFAAQARQRLPKARLKMFTNGTLLTIDLLRRLMPSFDRIFINNYNMIPEMHPNIREVHDFCLTPEGQTLLSGKSLVIQLRHPQVVLSSRGGEAPNRRPPSKAPAFKCLYPFSQLVIRPDGRISLCCNDALGKMTLGDATSQSLSEIWQGPAFTQVRHAMIHRGRAGIPLCAACDFLG